MISHFQMKFLACSSFLALLLSVTVAHISTSYQFFNTEQSHSSPWWFHCAVGTWRWIWSDAQYVRLSVSLPAAGASASYIALLNCRSVTELRLHHCPHVLMWHSQSYQRCPPPLLHPHIHTQPVPPRVLPTLGWSWHVCVTEQRWRWALRSYSAPNADAECSENCLNQSHAFL